MTYMDELNDIWDGALENHMCICGTDNRWEQDIAGQITCGECNTDVTDARTETIRRESNRIRSAIKNIHKENIR